MSRSCTVRPMRTILVEGRAVSGPLARSRNPVMFGRGNCLFAFYFLQRFSGKQVHVESRVVHVSVWVGVCIKNNENLIIYFGCTKNECINSKDQCFLSYWPISNQLICQFGIILRKLLTSIYLSPFYQSKFEP